MLLNRSPIALQGVAISLFALTLLLVPTLGALHDTLIQDTLKSALLAIGTLLTTALLLAHRAALPDLAPHRIAPQWHPAFLIPMALAAYALFSMAWSHTYLAATAAARWCVVGLLMWIAMRGLPRQGLTRVLHGLHWGASVAGFWACCQFWFDLTWFTQGPSPAATFFNRNFYAEFAVSVLPLSAWLLARTQQRRLQYGIAVSGTINLCTIVMTSTRSALLALAIILPALVTAMVAHYRRAPTTERAAVRQITLACVALALMLVNLPSRSTHLDATTPGVTAWQRSFAHAAALAQPGALTTGSVAVRRQLWLGSLRMLSDHPWSGVGAGAWEVFIPRYQDSNTELEIDYYAHNEYLQLLAEYGWPVGGGVLALLAALVLQAIQQVWRDAHAEVRQQRFFALLAVLALLLVSAAGFPWHLAGTTALLGLCLGWLGAVDAPAASVSPTPTTPLQHRVQRRMHWALGVVILATVLAIYLTQRAVRAEYQLTTALMMADKLPKDPRPLDAETAAHKAEMLAHLRAGMALNPHYRALIPMAAEVTTLENDWDNTTWILASSVASRPYIYALWKGLAQAAIGRNDGPAALDAVSHLRSLKPDAWTTRVLGVEALSIAGQDAQALSLLQQCLEHPDANMDYNVTQLGYALGLKHQDQALALRALNLRNQYWPAQAADTNWRIGHLYATVPPLQPARALQAFTEGWRSVPRSDRSRFRDSVPPPYQQQLPLNSSP